jgi:hypothetical protein
MSSLQIERITQYLESYASLSDPVRPEAHHGMCIGADFDFHRLCRPLKFFIIGHPGLRPDGKCLTRAQCECDFTHPEKPFPVRDRDIVNASPLLFATPRGFVEEAAGSGTWATIRYARTRRKRIIIIWPDGSTREES